MSEQKGSYTTRKFHDPLDDMLDRPIAYNPAFKRITGSTVAALMLSQAWYWSKRTSDEDGWFYKTQAEWEDETGLTRSEQETARRHLTEAGIMEERLSGIPARLYYRIDKQEIYSLLGLQYAEIPQTGLPESPPPVGDIPANINKNTETTTETTSEITNNKQNSIFVDHFRSFNGKREKERWDILVEAIGSARAEEIASWAERREIHMTNRGGLMDSLETAAKKWTEPTIARRPAKGDNTEFFKNLATAAKENNAWLPEKKLLSSSAT